ncbi:MAG: hypothetical protein ACOC1P_03140 [Minisyncoccales bacterium]
MGETLNIKKTTPYGVELQEPKEDGSRNFRNATEKVRNFLKNQVPCSIEVEEMEKNEISRVKVLSKVQDAEKTGQGIDPNTLPSADNVNYSDDRQKSIESQFCIREALRMIEIQNSLGEEKIKPTQNTLYETALIVRNVLDQLKG